MGFEAGSEQSGLVHIPFADAFEILRTPFIVEDEGRDLVAQALLEHEQPTDAPVAVSEGADALKAHMEVQNLRQQMQGFCMFSISLRRNGYQVSVENDLDFIISYSDYLDKQFGDCLFLLKRILRPTVNTVLDFFGR